MKIKKIISKGKAGNRMEVITEYNDGILRTRHIHQDNEGKWRYYAGHRSGQPIFSTLSTEVEEKEEGGNEC